MAGQVMEWGEFCCEIVSIPPTSLQQSWITMIGIGSTSNNHSSSVSGPLRFGLCWNAGQYYWVDLAHSDGLEGVVMPWKFCIGAPIPPASIQKAWATMVGLGSTSTNHSSSVSGPPDLASAEMLANCFSVLSYGKDIEGSCGAKR